MPSHPQIEEKDKLKSTVKQAGLGAGLFTMAIVIIGLVYLANRIGK